MHVHKSRLLHTNIYVYIDVFVSFDWVSTDFFTFIAIYANFMQSKNKIASSQQMRTSGREEWVEWVTECEDEKDIIFYA